MASVIQCVLLDKVGDSLLENIADKHSDSSRPETFVRNRWGRIRHENMLAALQELQNTWQLNVRAATPAYHKAVRDTALDDAKAIIDLQWLSEPNKKQIKEALERLKSQPETSEPELDTDALTYKRMFKSAAYALALINAALDIGPDEAGGAGPILDAIEKLKASQAYPNRPSHLSISSNMQGQKQSSQ